MPNYNSDRLFLHPMLHAALPGMLEAIQKKLPAGWTPRTGSQGIHRTPNEQFEIYKKGRQFVNGVWKKVGTTYTGKDGFKNKSRHNYLPATAVDIVLIQPNGVELEAGPQENKIKAGALAFGFEWGGDWPEGQQDLPHIQLPLSKLFKSSLDRDETLQWQKYLFHAGALTDASQLDGNWGDISKSALNTVAGTREQTPAAWETLFNRFGSIEEMTDFDGFAWVPKVK